MTTFELDLSKSDSFIDGIQEIFKPPSVESSTNVRISKSYMKSLHSSAANDTIINDDTDYRISVKQGTTFWKKPKSNAHEYCDSCGTFEGERLVCDRCPASFHLECLDPPIENDEAPVGVWYCNRCTAIMKDEEDKFSCTSRQSQNKVEADTANATNGGTDINTLSAKRSGQSTSSGSSEITTEMLTEEVPLKKRKWSECEAVSKHLTALQNIQDVVHCINPKEFELPKNLIPGIKLPFSFKTNAEMKTKSVVSLENGIIPSPLVTCFECSKTCFYGSLIQCDYCPLYFHLDCLDPPLVQLPSRVERWMCPNHIEQVIDKSGMIKTIRLSERMNAYDEIQQRIKNMDEVDLLTNFALGRGFRFGSKMEEIIKEKPKVQVPDAVKRQYNTLPMAKPRGNHSEQSMFNEQQKEVLQNILRASGQNIDICESDPLTLLHATLNSIHGLVESQTINISTELSVKPRLSNRPGADQVKCRALLIPISNDQNTENLPPPIRMIYRNFDIGSGIDNDCVVTGCKYVSPRHASISYIDNHFCFELFNYSRYGTIVDDLLYYNDVTDKETHSSCPTNQNIKDIRAFIDCNGTVSSTRSNNKMISNSMHCQRDLDKEVDNCLCTEYGYTNNGVNNCVDHGWESTASLKFGSVIRVGCQKFLFTSMTETGRAADFVVTQSECLSHTSSLSSECKSDVLKPQMALSPKSDSDLRSPKSDIVEQGKVVTDRRISDDLLSCDMEIETADLSSEEINMPQ